MLDIIGASYIRDIDAGEMVSISKDGIEQTHCSRRAIRVSVFLNIFILPVRFNSGRRVSLSGAQRYWCPAGGRSPADADLIIPVPDSGVPAAIGFAQAANLPFELGIIRNHYVGRTFIQPTQEGRQSGVMLKHNAEFEIIAGKNIVLVDDSIVRGTTSRKIVNMMRDAGANKVHMRIASPPTTNPCYYGVDTPDRDKLMAAQLGIDEMCAAMACNSLAFISIDGLYRAMGLTGRNHQQPEFCDACFTGDYPLANMADQFTQPRT